MAAETAGRERIGKKRSIGQLIQWKGKYGWIRPDVAIEHPAASKRGGKIYLGLEDIEGGDVPPVKSMVSFIVYVDDTGLGAMFCKSAPGAAKPAKGDGKGGVIRTIQKQSIISKGNIGKGVGKAMPLRAKAKARREPLLVEAREPPPAPDKTLRERVFPKRAVGRLFRWKGSTGWIRPSEPIDHPEAEKHRRAVYLHEADVQPGHEMFPGAQVTFFVYTDGDGLGAEHVMLTKDQPPEAPRAQNGAGGKGIRATKGTGKGARESLAMVQKTRGKRRGGKKSKGEDGEEGEKTKGGPDLPRERVTVIPVNGEVLEWKGKFGWLSSTETIEHEKSTKHDGKIYVNEKDILAGGPLEKGQLVEFHVYADSSGLGAEEVIALSS